MRKLKNEELVRKSIQDFQKDVKNESGNKIGYASESFFWDMCKMI